MRGRGWLVAAALAAVAPGCALFRPAPEPPPVVSGTQVGLASWYGPGFHGRPTASGERFDQYAMTAAHRTLPLGTRAQVTSLANERAVRVRINDRGPFVGDRIVDLSYAAARELHMIGPGVMRVRLDVLDVPPAARPGARSSRRPVPSRRARPAARPRTPLAAPAPAAPEAAAPPGYVVALGPFPAREAADAAQRAIAPRFPEARVTTDGATYGVALGPYAARRSAEARAQVVGLLGYAAAVQPRPAR